MANRADLKLRTPDRWYYVQYANGIELSQLGFPRKELAESFKNAVDETIRQRLKSGCNLMEGRHDKIIEAKGWSVDGKVFSDYHEALWYKWTERPDAIIKGVFNK